jgi:hypothetical protein
LATGYFGAPHILRGGPAFPAFSALSKEGSKKGVGGETHVERLPQAIVGQHTGANVSGGPIAITSFQSDSQDLQYANQIRQEMPNV